MAKTIQVRVEDEMKKSADILFSSLGLDTSTAIRMFLAASMEMGGIPFPVVRRHDRDNTLLEAMERRRNGETFLSAEQSLKNMRSAINAGIKHGS